MKSVNAGFTPEEYAASMEYEYAGMINALKYLSEEAESAKLELVCLHLNIAISELKEHHLPGTPAELEQPLAAAK